MSAPWLFVLAGGSGSRFWPRSRAKRPKQFLPIAGDEPLLVTTVRRFAGWIPNDRVVVGSYKTKKEADREAGSLKGRGSIASYFVWRLP